MRKCVLYDITWASNVPSDDIIVILIEEAMSCRITMVHRVFIYFNVRLSSISAWTRHVDIYAMKDTVTLREDACCFLIWKIRSRKYYAIASGMYNILRVLYLYAAEIHNGRIM